jgi:hypothetical protein
MPISYIETASLDTALNAPTATALSTASGSAPSYSARAWVNFNGTGTVAIRASGNVSSITDNGTGAYTVNFTNAMPDVNYCALGLGYLWWITSGPVARTTSSFNLNTFSSGTFANTDQEFVNVAVFR